MPDPFAIVAGEKPDMLQHAIRYATKYKIPVFPCSRETKAPLTPRGFQDATTDPDRIHAWWSQYPNASIGMPTGKASGIFVIDVDIDDKKNGMESLRELEQANEPLPPTKQVITGSGGRHLWFRYPINGMKLGNSASKLGQWLDTRGDGGYVIVPPSVHPSGNIYKYDNFVVKPAPMPDWLIDLLKKPKHESLPPSPPRPLTNGDGSRYGLKALDGILDEMRAAPVGQRNATLNSLSYRLGQLVAGGELPEHAGEHLRDAARQTGLTAREIEKTFRSGFEDGTRQPASAPEKQTAKKRNPTANDNQPPSVEQQDEPEQLKKPEIYLQSGNRPNYLNQTRLILLKTGGIYQRGGALVRVVRYDKTRPKKRISIPDGSLHINMLKPISLAAYIEQSASVLKFNKSAKNQENPNGTWLPANYPREDAAMLIEDVHISGLPYLKAIISAPAMRQNGTIIRTQGYDEDTCLFLDSDGIDFGVEKIPAKPAMSDAQRSLLVLDELICGFPFVDGASKSVALAAMLTAIIRPTLPTAPMFCFSAPTAGSGKSKLADLVATIATARPAATISYTTDETEFKKVGAAILIHGHAINNLDNVNGKLRSDWLCQVLTSEEVNSRVLGESRDVTTPTLCTWLATGNNIEPQGDLTRRVLFCKIDPETDRPDERVFDFDPIERCLSDWPRYVRAALTLLKAYHEAGRPKQPIQQYGSFEEWSDTVRSALVWAGAPDPCETRKALETGDSTRRELRALLSAWWDSDLRRFNAQGRLMGYTTGEIIEEVQGDRNHDLKEALEDVCGDKMGKLQSRVLGRYLNMYVGRVEKCATASNEVILLRINNTPLRGRRMEYLVENVNLSGVRQC